MNRPGAWRVVVLALFMAPTIGASPAAAVPAYTFETGPGYVCVSGDGPADQPLTVTLRSPGGALRDSQSTSAASDGRWQVCFDVTIRSGDKLTAKQGALQRAVTVPALTIHADRVSNKVTGAAPAGKQIAIVYQRCFANGCPAPEPPQYVTAGSNGRYSLLLTDIDGTDRLAAVRTTTAGDIFTAETVTAYFRIRDFGRNTLFYWAADPGPVTFTLRAPGGVLRATLTKQRPVGGGYILRFRRNGAPVAIRAGDVVKGDFAADTRMVVPAVTLTYDVGAKTVSGHCFPDRHYWLSVSAVPNSGGTIYGGTTNATGDWTQAVTELDSGYHLDAICENKTGDQARLVADIP